MNFSKKSKNKLSSRTIQVSEINEDLRNSIWNGIHSFLDEYIIEEYLVFSKKPYTGHENRNNFYNIFTKLEWFEVYDLIEFFFNYFKEIDKEFDLYIEFADRINIILQKELSGYRLLNGVITDIAGKQEVEILEENLSDEDFPNVKAHLQRALELLSDRKNPDYRNSIKESISAVESIAKEISKTPKAELGDALKEIEKQGKLHGAMKKAFLNLYGYTSDANGIRHSLMEEPNLTADDAKFFLLVCTSFINYLKTKI